MGSDLACPPYKSVSNLSILIYSSQDSQHENGSRKSEIASALLPGDEKRSKVIIVQSLLAEPLFSRMAKNPTQYHNSDIALTSSTFFKRRLPTFRCIPSPTFTYLYLHVTGLPGWKFIEFSTEGMPLQEFNPSIMTSKRKHLSLSPGEDLRLQ